MLLALPVGLAALPGCGGGTAAAAATGTTPTPTPAATGTGLSAVTSWASRPAVAASTGQAILVTDVGVNGSIWVSNGQAWVPLATPLTLAHKFSNARMDGTVGANTDVLLDSHTIPAYVLGPMSALRITAAYSFNGSGTANRAPQIKAYFGLGSYASGYYSLLDTRDQFSTQKSFLFNVTLQNKNSLLVNQIRPNDYALGASGNAFASAAIDFTQAVTLGFGALNNASSANAADQQVLEWLSIELIA
jgi:hypothetical protein